MKKYGIGMIASLFAFILVVSTLTSCSDDDNSTTAPVDWVASNNSGSIAVEIKPVDIYYNNVQLTVEPEGGSIVLTAENWPSFEMTGMNVNGEYPYMTEDEDGNPVEKIASVENSFVFTKDFEDETKDTQAEILAAMLCKSAIATGNQIALEFEPLGEKVTGSLAIRVRIDKQISIIRVTRK